MITKIMTTREKMTDMVMTIMGDKITKETSVDDMWLFLAEYIIRVHKICGA